MPTCRHKAGESHDDGLVRGLSVLSPVYSALRFFNLSSESEQREFLAVNTIAVTWPLIRGLTGLNTPDMRRALVVAVGSNALAVKSGSMQRIRGSYSISA